MIGDWERVASGELGLHEISPQALAWYTLGHKHGIDAMTEAVLQAKHEAARLHVAAFNPADRVALIQRRMQAALDAMPDDFDSMSFEGIEAQLQAAIGGAA